MCWDNVLLDVRTRELLKIFVGYRYIILRLVSSDAEQIKQQMIHRHNNEGRLYYLENVERAN